MTLAPYAKAITAALVAALTCLGTALTDGTVTASDWVAVALALLTALYAVWAVPNADPTGEHQDESVQPPEGRHARPPG